MSQRKELQQACALFESFREAKPRKIKTVQLKVPSAVAVIGHVEFIGYKTTHGKKITLYKHDFAPGSRPLLCSSPNGKQLLLLGGRYEFDERGIVDKDSKGRDVDTSKHGKVLDSDD
jgi:hypothetical protein